ncbi:FAD-binding oxidoreductase [Streptomyces sp. NPDC001606]
MATGTADVVTGVNDWLARHPGTGTPPRRITVRSGGHCYEDFVCGDDVSVIIDVGAMDRVAYDPDLDAWCVEAGASNWHIATQFYRRHGLALPGGSCYSVAAGGHVPAGGFGLLSRWYGLTVDHLYAVEVVTVRDGTRAEVTLARAVVQLEQGEHVPVVVRAHEAGGAAVLLALEELAVPAHQ